MSDIVERLKYELENDGPFPGTFFVESDECLAEITRLRADKAALVEALEAAYPHIQDDDELGAIRSKVSAALLQAKGGEP